MSVFVDRLRYHDSVPVVVSEALALAVQMEDAGTVTVALHVVAALKEHVIVALHGFCEDDVQVLCPP